ncbi:MAG: endo-1,4-beta-xylanase, partial [Gemmatimonadota bacterium]|nr:endo-1,4-beta-xylanase [Gemmatimonadota bacterium]
PLVSRIAPRLAGAVALALLGGGPALAQRYADFFRVYRKHRDVITRVTFWNVTDADSWLNNWPVRGRTNHPLLFDWRGQPKPAFSEVVRAARPVAVRKE